VSVPTHWPGTHEWLSRRNYPVMQPRYTRQQKRLSGDWPFSLKSVAVFGGFWGGVENAQGIWHMSGQTLWLLRLDKTSVS
jgi:hypothetical protein